MLDLTNPARLAKVRDSLTAAFGGYARPPSRSPFHRWYVLNMAYSHRVVQSLFASLGDVGQLTVVDPFCGSGTTLVEAASQGHKAIGIDANPACVFFSRVKTDVTWNPYTLLECANDAILVADDLFAHRTFIEDERYVSIARAGLVERGWISAHKLGRVVCLLQAIEGTATDSRYGNALRAAAVAATRDSLADIRFGPELTCLSKPKRTHVSAAFLRKVQEMAEDAASAPDESGCPRARVVEGDSRDLEDHCERADMVVTSPPYPTDHDYARNTRLELHLLGHVSDIQSLRTIKQGMIRCSTKSVYIDDTDGELVARHPRVSSLVRALKQRAKDRTDGFARVAPDLIRQYFGGMLRHLTSTARVLKPGGLAAYVIADQQSFSGVYINTPSIVEQLAVEQAGLRSFGRVTVGRRKGTTGTRCLRESVLLLAHA